MRANLARCLPGYVWRVIRPQDLACVPPESRDLAATENREAPQHTLPPQLGQNSAPLCKPGYVWRNAFSGDIVCVTPAARDRVQQENQMAASRTVATGNAAPPAQLSGSHNVTLGPSQSLHFIGEKTFTEGCVRWGDLAVLLKDKIGWGQAKNGDTPCMAFTLQTAARFDTSALDAIPTKIINRAVLSYDESQAQFCPLEFGFTFTCWQGGNGNPENKPNGCVVVRIPTVDWLQPQKKIPLDYAPGAPFTHQISPHSWDVTEPLSWQVIRGAAPLGATPGFGFLLTGALYIDHLTGHDNTVCVSDVSNVRIDVTYTVPPDGQFRAPR